MPAHWLLFGKYFLLLYVTLWLCIGLGHGVLKLLPKASKQRPSWAGLFVRGLLGVTVLSVITSLIFTQFGTIQLFFFAIGGFLYLELRLNEPANNSAPDFKLLRQMRSWRVQAPLLLSSLILFCWFAFMLFNHGQETLAVPNGDNIFYALLSETIPLAGEENQFNIAALVDDFYTGSTPYHYFEIHLTSFFNLFSSPAILNFYLLALPLLNLLTILGFLAIAELYGKPQLFAWLLCPLLLLCGGLYLHFQDMGFNAYSYNFAASPLDYFGAKLGALCPFIAMALLLFLSARQHEGLIVLLALPIVNIATGPGLLGGMAAYIFTQLIFTKKDHSAFWRSLLYLSATVGFIYVFYKGQLLGTTAVPYFAEDNPMAYTDGRSGFKVMLIEWGHRILAYPARMLNLHLPFIFILLLMRKHIEWREVRKPLLLIFCVYTVSLLTYTLFYKLPDARQLYNTNLLLVNLFIASIFLRAVISGLQITGKKRGFVVLIASFGILLLLLKGTSSIYQHQRFKEINNRFSTTYRQQVNDLLKGIEGPIQGGYLAGDKHFISTQALGLAAELTGHLTYSTEAMGAHNISDAVAIEALTGSNGPTIFESLPFYRFTRAIAAKNPSVSVKQTQLSFIKTHELRYLIVQATALAPTLPKDSLAAWITDERSGESFILLK